MPLRFAEPTWVKAIDALVDSAFVPLRRVPALNRLAYLASEGADYSRCWHAVALAMAVARPDLRPRAVRMVVTLGVESVLVNGMIKPLFRRDRPADWEVDEHQVRRPKTTSFPSGHASSAVVAATLLSDALPKARPLWWSAAAVVAGSRIHTRMHHASDVVAGAVLGALIGRVACRITAGTVRAWRVTPAR
jgi:undecaprenyl-diphosphatase